jgi:phenylpropionate dioxygenase-like ring-hydroxylating dioxygenase large terminal subunit
VRVSGFAVEWKTHWTRAMENMLDWPHLPFVHRKTIGRGMQGRTGGRMDVTWEDRPWGAHTHIAIDGKAEKGSLDLRWPNQMNLHISPPGKQLMMAVACVPLDAQRTTMLLIMARDFLTSPLFDFFFHKMNARIANEDRAIVESSFPVEVPPAGEERSVRTDGATLAFRKRYFAELWGSSAGEGASAAKRALPVAG